MCEQNQQAPAGRRLRGKLLMGFANEAQGVALATVALGRTVGRPL